MRLKSEPTSIVVDRRLALRRQRMVPLPLLELFGREGFGEVRLWELIGGVTAGA
jgi:hypothetical protein